MKIVFDKDKIGDQLFRVGLSKEDYSYERERLRNLVTQKNKKKKDTNIAYLCIDRENNRLPDISQHTMACHAGVSVPMFFARFRQAYELKSNNALFLLVKDNEGRYAPLHMNQTLGELPKNEHGFVDMLYCEERTFG